MPNDYTPDEAVWSDDITEPTDDDEPTALLFNTPYEQLANNAAILKPHVTKFTASGSYTVPARTAYLEIICVGPGGPGGNGATAGGGGGGSGEIKHTLVPLTGYTDADSLGPITVTIDAAYSMVERPFQQPFVHVKSLVGNAGSAAVTTTPGAGGTAVSSKANAGGAGVNGAGTASDGGEVNGNALPGTAGTAVANGGGGVGYGAGGGGAIGSAGSGGGGAAGFQCGATVVSAGIGTGASNPGAGAAGVVVIIAHRGGSATVSE
jgi:hypothetical protein